MIDEPCPACGNQLDMDSAVGHRGTPDPGDVSVAVCCGVVLWYQRDSVTGSLHRVVMPGEEIERMPAEQRSLLETVLGVMGKQRTNGEASRSCTSSGNRASARPR